MAAIAMLKWTFLTLQCQSSCYLLVYETRVVWGESTSLYKADLMETFSVEDTWCIFLVLVADVLVYFLAAVWFVAVCMPEWTWLEKVCIWISSLFIALSFQLACLMVMLLQPSMVIIDHGHFQYNCISLGLALFGVVTVVHNWDLVGSVAFTLSLNYKQMELYHALPFFFYLLGKSLHCHNK